MLTYDAHCAHFERLIADGAREIIHVSLSGGLSPTANVAAQAARDVAAKHPGCHIYPVDSFAATIGQGALVREAVRLRAEGKGAAETSEAIKEIPFHLQYAIIANDLYYLKRGGRVSAIAAAAGTVLKIKPVLSFTREGKLIVLEKCKGMKKAFSRTLERMEKMPPVEEGRIIRIVHTDAEEQAEELADLVEARWGTRPEISIMGPVIGSHVGPGSVSMSGAQRRSATTADARLPCAVFPCGPVRKQREPYSRRSPCGKGNGRAGPGRAFSAEKGAPAAKKVKNELYCLKKYGILDGSITIFLFFRAAVQRRSEEASWQKTISSSIRSQTSKQIFPVGIRTS